jgi:hypothetical protein
MSGPYRGGAPAGPTGEPERLTVVWPAVLAALLAPLIVAALSELGFGVLFRSLPMDHLANQIPRFLINSAIGGVVLLLGAPGAHLELQPDGMLRFKTRHRDLLVHPTEVRLGGCGSTFGITTAHVRVDGHPRPIGFHLGHRRSPRTQRAVDLLCEADARRVVQELAAERSSMEPKSTQPRFRLADKKDT